MPESTIPARALGLAGPVLDRFGLQPDPRHVVEFLVDNQLQMARFAFRQDASDPDVTAEFAAVVTTASQLNSISTEEHLKMLCLMTVADVGASGREALTSWKAGVALAPVRQHA